MKRSASSRLKEAIISVAAGRKYFDPLAAEELVEIAASGRSLDDDEFDRLTPRERQVLKLLAEGHTSRQIAKALSISLKTAMTHRSNVMNKLGLHSRVELVKYAIRRGVVTADGA